MRVQQPLTAILLILIGALTAVPSGAEECVDPPWIPDPALRRAIGGQLGISGGAVDCAALKKLRFLSASRAGIHDLEGLQFAENLETLRLIENSISSLAPLASCTKLKEAHLYGDSIEDISGLSQLPRLQKLVLRGNRLDSEDLYQLPTRSLQTLDLARNQISDISALSQCDELTELSLGANSVSDLRPLALLTRLRELRAGQNPISGIPRFSTRHLEVLELPYCEISDLGPLATQYSLRELHLRNNAITDLGPIKGLSGLRYLDVGGNRVEELASLRNHPGLPPGSVALLYQNRLDLAEKTTDRKIVDELVARGVKVNATQQQSL